MMRTSSYDRRNVRFEEIHEVRASDLLDFVKLGRPRDGYRVLDVGCGYGAVTCSLAELVTAPDSGILSIQVDLLDESAIQLDRARREVKDKLKPYAENCPVAASFFHGTFPSDFLEWSERYDIIYAKQVLHETSEAEQAALVAALFTALKPGGRLIVWEVALDDDPELGDLFRNAIREKDRLAQYDTLVENRHFLARGNLLRALQDHGGLAPTVTRTIQYRFRSHLRLEPELDGNRTHLTVLNKFILQLHGRLPEAKRARLNLTAQDNSVDFDVPVVIATAIRPERVTLSTLSLFDGLELERPDKDTVRVEVIEAAISHDAGKRVFETIGPSLVRFSFVQWHNERRPVLGPAGLDFALQWADEWPEPARAYAAYLASLFLSSENNAERSFRQSATGFIATWFDRRSAASIAHFELDDSLLRIAAVTTRATVVDERAFQLPPKWEGALNTFQKLFYSNGPNHVPLGEFGVRLVGDEEHPTVDELAASMARKFPGGNKLLKQAADAMSMPPDAQLSAELLLRLACYLKLAGCRHAYYFVPPSLTFQRIPRAGGGGRLDVGNIHIATQEPIDPATAIELLHWQAAVWQSLGAVEALAGLIREQGN